MSLFNQSLLEAVVLFESKKGRKFTGNATGFLIGFKHGNKGNYHTFILTNKHVFNNKHELYVSFDSNGVKRKRARLELIKINGQKTWFEHRFKEVDLALLPISMQVIQQIFGSSNKWIPEDSFLYMKDFENKGIYPGDELYFVGFPLGLSGKLKNSPIIRSGIVSRIDKEIIRDTKSLLLDGQNFPGNSGGPVFTKPELMSLNGTLSIKANLLIGVIKGYLPHTNHFIDPSSGRISALSVENSGLCLFVPMDYAKQIYNAWIKTGKPIYI